MPSSYDLSLNWTEERLFHGQLACMDVDIRQLVYVEELLDFILRCKEAYEDPSLMDLVRALCYASIGDLVMEKELQVKILVGEYYAYLEVLSARGISPETLSEEELKKLSLPDLRTLVQRTRDLARTPSRG